MNIGEKVVGIEKDIEYLKSCCDQFSKMKNGDHDQDKSIIEMKSEIKNLEEFMEAHKQYHDKLAEKQDSRNWQLWIILITLVVTTLGGVVAIKLF